jgi:tetraacyldisaccharide 4'-kinase
MKTPDFWYQPAGLLACLLWPAGWLYGRVTGWRMSRKGAVLNVPVVCIGNFTAGGAGKTPTTIAVLAMLAAMGEKPFVVSRGYGGRSVGPLLVDPAIHSAEICGDEPLLLARHAPTVVARSKLDGAQFAQAAGATVVVLDDGLQNPSLNKDFTVCVVDGAAGVGNGFCLPAGPLRAPLPVQLNHVHLVLIIGEGAAGEGICGAMARLGKPCAKATLVPHEKDVEALRGKPLSAFAGIGRPEKFFSTLHEAGLDVVLSQAFADHHPYSDAEVEGLLGEADQRGLTLVTTQKDAVRLGTRNADLATLAVTLQPEGTMLIDTLRSGLNRKSR